MSKGNLENGKCWGSKVFYHIQKHKISTNKIVSAGACVFYKRTQTAVDKPHTCYIFYDITVCYATLLEPYITYWSDKASPPLGIKLWLTVNLWSYKAEHTLLCQFLSHFHIKQVGSQSLDSCAITLLALSYHFFNFWSWLINKHLMKCITLSKQVGGLKWSQGSCKSQFVKELKDKGMSVRLNKNGTGVV